MKASVKLFVTDGVNASGMFPVKLVVSHKGKTKRKTIGYSNEANWNNLKNLPKPAHPDFENLYGACLDIQKKSVQLSFLQMESVTGAMAFLLNEKKKVGITVSEYFDVEIKNLKQQNRYGTAANYEYVKERMDAFKAGVKFNEITPDFIERFKRSLKINAGDVTVISYLGRLRALYNKAVMDPDVYFENIRPFEFSFKDLTIVRGRVKNRYLEKEQFLNLISGKDTLPAAQKRAVDFSLIQFYLGGLNLKDLYFLKNEDFYGNRVTLKRAKLGKYKKEFDVLVVPEAAKLINQYKGSDPEYVFDYRKDNKGYIVFRNNHNRNLRAVQKKLGVKLAPINQNLNSNTFRHTFATYGKHLLLHPDIIRELMGHERKDTDTIYKDAFPEAMRDEAHLKIIELKTKK